MNCLPYLTENEHHLPGHLTDEQFAELLDQTAGAITQQHLLRCTACQSEIAVLRASLTNFRTAATNLAAVKTPALTRRSVPSPVLFRGFRRHVWAAALGTVAAMLAGSVVLLHPSRSVNNGAAPSIAIQANAPAVSDEALLDGIQQDLSDSIPPSLEPLAVPATQN